MVEVRAFGPKCHSWRLEAFDRVSSIIGEGYLHFEESLRTPRPKWAGEYSQGLPRETTPTNVRPESGARNAEMQKSDFLFLAALRFWRPYSYRARRNKSNHPGKPVNPGLNGAKLGQFGMVLRPEGTRGFSPGFQPWERDSFDDAPANGAG